MLTSETMDIKQKVILSPEQQMVLKLVVDDGKSVFFTGSAGGLSSTTIDRTELTFFGDGLAGTGKSVLLREIIASLKRKYKGAADAVAVTASTGMAACNIGGTTIHSFAGIGLGNDAVDLLIGKVKKNRVASGKWQRVKVLVIDEGEFAERLDLGEWKLTSVHLPQSPWSTVSSLTSSLRSALRSRRRSALIVPLAAYR